jgi:serine/threonine protein kinase
VEAFKQCLKALNYLHTQPRPIIHGGIKPANILVDDTKEGIWIKLADIGLARGGNEPKLILRTSSYCPPEFNSGTVALGHTTAVDIWSMGMTACQLSFPFPLYRKLGKKGCQELIDYVQRKLDDGKTPKISRLLRFILDNMLVIKPDLRKIAGECLDALVMMHRNTDNDGRCEEDSEEENEEDEEDEEDKEDRGDENRNDDDDAGGGNGGSRGRRDDHKVGTRTARPRSAVQAHPIRTLKRTGSSSAPSSNGSVAKRQYIPSPPETNDTQPYGEMTSEASKSRISENPRPLSRTPLPFRRGQIWASPPSS